MVGKVLAMKRLGLFIATVVLMMPSAAAASTPLTKLVAHLATERFVQRLARNARAEWRVFPAYSCTRSSPYRVQCGFLLSRGEEICEGESYVRLSHGNVYTTAKWEPGELCEE
jgi:hypothetical protein